MNKVLLLGRLARDPKVTYSQSAEAIAIARYTLAVDRRVRRTDGEQDTADFINCVAFGKSAEFAEKYLKQGTKIAIEGRIQTGSYTNKDGQKVYTTDIVVESQEFAESKGNSTGNGGNYSGGRNNGSGNQMASQQSGDSIGDGFMNIPDGVEDEGLPFN